MITLSQIFLSILTVSGVGLLLVLSFKFDPWEEQQEELLSDYDRLNTGHTFMVTYKHKKTGEIKRILK